MTRRLAGVSDDASFSAGQDLRADLDLRLVRYFTVVAEQLNFGRAAEALHVAQPSLSRQIQRLEDQLGVRLLDRTPRGSRLTEAGTAFLPKARALISGAQQAVRSARDAVSPREITIGYTEDFVITAAVRELRHRHPDAQVHTRHLHWNETTALTDGRVDALVARLPLPMRTDQLRVSVLYQEPMVLVVPSFHRLAGKESVTMSDLSGEAITPCTGTAAAWTELSGAEPRPAGSPAPTGPTQVLSYQDKIEFVADGRAVAILPAGDRRTLLRDDLTTVPIDGIDPCQVVVASRADDQHPLVTGFHESARAHLTGHR
jgi:DNA-binding transcriptional LysR family regulator